MVKKKILLLYFIDVDCTVFLTVFVTCYLYPVYLLVIISFLRSLLALFSKFNHTRVGNIPCIYWEMLFRSIASLKWWAASPEARPLLWENPIEPPPLPLQIRMRYENTQSRDKKQLNENRISFKMHNCKNLYNVLKKMFISGGFRTLLSILLSKHAHRTVHYR